MSLSKVLVSVALAAVAVQTAYASSGASFAGGEVGFIPHNTPGTMTRAQVEQELLASGQNKAATDGVQFVGGEVGYFSTAHSYKFDGGKLVHADSLQHNAPKPDWRMSATERRAFAEQYIN
ncbi:MAG: DUF4148 domain-containing protein [Pseudomonadota bacterium]